MAQALFIMNISTLKAKYGRLFRVITPSTNTRVYFKLISKIEYDRYIEMAQVRDIINPDAEEYILTRAVISHTYEELEDTLFAGEFHSIAEAIIDKSGFHNFDDFVAALKKSREQSLTLIDQILSFIAKAFPIYKISDLEAMTGDELARLLALSEGLLGQRLDIPGAEIEEPSKSTKPTLKRPDVSKMTEEEKRNIENTRKRALEVLQSSRSKRNI